MKISDSQIDRIIQIHQEKLGQDFESRKDAEEYLRTLCEIFDWLLKNKSKITTQYEHN